MVFKWEICMAINLRELQNNLRRIHMKQCKQFTLKKKLTFAWSIMYLYEWKHFCRMFLLSLLPLLVSFFFSFVSLFCHLRHFKTIRCIVKSLIPNAAYFLLKSKWKRKLEKRFLGTRVWAPKQVYWSLKWPKYVTGNHDCMNETELSKHVWDSKDHGFVNYL